ncbi:MAG TPA: response regulator transcription factor [Dehalococcoidia bacterium]|nr:response regulator transcription factor [Dehalococcoidia bacterium]HLB29394.1 response regulator transcription factor [Dehalococcoidia bacterium]
MAKLRILIVDDHGVLRAGLRALLNSQPDMEACGEAANGYEAVTRAAEASPDIVLLDLKMPGLDGFEALRRIKAQNPAVKVLVLSMYEDESYLRRVLEAGASGYVLKRAADAELLSAIRAVHGGGIYLDPSLSRTVVEGFLSQAARPRSGAKEGEDKKLSEREEAVLRLLAYGHTNQEIAAKLFLSVKTVEGYKARLMEKLGVRSRAALVRYALQEGLLTSEP